MPAQPALIRQARPSDANAMAQVHIESSQDAYASLARHWPTPDLSARAALWASSLAASQLDPTRVDLVATLAGAVVAFIGGGPARRKDLAAELEVYVIHVLPEHRGKGLGSELWSVACEHIRGAALSAMYVETFAELRCSSFYENHGGEIINQTPGAFHGGSVTKLVYLWPAGSSSNLIAPR